MRDAAKLALGLLLVVGAGTEADARSWPEDRPAAADRGALDRPLSADRPGGAWVAGDQDGVPTVLWGAPGERAPSAEPIAAARWHLRRQGLRYGVSDAALASLTVHLLHPTRGGGALVWLDQELDGLPVYPARVSVLVDAGGGLVAIGGRPLELPTGAPAPATLRADEAVATALTDLFEAPIDASLLTDAGPRADGWRGFGLAPGAGLAAGLSFCDEARAMPIWTPTPAGLERAFRVELQARAAGDAEDRAWAYVIDAARGAVLRRTDMVHDGSFRLWLTDDLRPRQGPQEDWLPHPSGVPNAGAPPYVAPTLATLEAFNTNPSGGSDPWLAPDATDLSGNNVVVFLDLASPSGYGDGDFRVAAETPGVFDATYDPTLPPAASDEQLQASAQPLFVVANWLHDWYYDAGFVEAAGNAQQSNYGRGGWGGDPLVIEGQDYGFGGAANTTVPGDGSAPRLQVGNWPGSPNRPGALDMSIVGHEWIHLMHLRLVYCLSQQCIAESEGWADFLAMHMLLDEGDDLDGSYAVAIYAAHEISLDSAYYGARRYPYSADFAKNPLTLEHIGQSMALPTTAPRNPFVGGTNNEVHRAGEVWATMLWQAYTELLRDTLGETPRLSYDEARRRMSEYAVTAMMLAPIDPNYTEQRDTLLAAAREVDLADYAALARGFAARGAGTCAVGAARESGTFDDVTESYEVAPILIWSLTGLDDADLSCDDAGTLDPGEAGRAHVSITNLGAAPLEGATLVIASETAELTLPEGGELTLDPVAPGAEVTIAVPVALDATAPAPLDAGLSLTLTAAGLCAGQLTRHDDVLTGYERAPASSYVETVELDAAGWSAAGSEGVWSIRRLGPGDHAFHGADISRPAVGRLVTPAMTVAAGASLVVGLRHAYRFEADTSGSSPTYYDGGIIEISTNDGASWQDLAGVSDLSYPGSVVAGSSPLSQHPAFVGESAGYPALDELAIDAGDGFGGQTVRLAFTVGADPFAGDEGWLIDDVAVTGVVAPPFDAVIPAPTPEGCFDLIADPGPEPVAEPGPEPVADTDVVEDVSDVVEDVTDVVEDVADAAEETTDGADVEDVGDTLDVQDSVDSVAGEDASDTADVEDASDTAEVEDARDASDVGAVPDTIEELVDSHETIDGEEVNDTAEIEDARDASDVGAMPDTVEDLVDSHETIDGEEVNDTAEVEEVVDVDDVQVVPDTREADTLGGDTASDTVDVDAMPDTVADLVDNHDTVAGEDVSDTAEVEEVVDVADVQVVPDTREADTLGRDAASAPDTGVTTDDAPTADIVDTAPTADTGSEIAHGRDGGGCAGGTSPAGLALAALALLALVRSRSRARAARRP